MISGKSTKIYLHRQIMGAGPLEEVDHISGDTLDNRRENLRIVNRQQNSTNKGPNRNNTSGYKGVSWDAKNGKWVAQITINGKAIKIGRYRTKSEAALAYDDIAAQLFGKEYIRRNIPDGQLWYSNWELTVIGWDDGIARIDIILPHNNPSTVSIPTTKEQVQPIANVIDKMLSELTGTKVKKVIDDGSDQPPTDGRLGSPTA